MSGITTIRVGDHIRYRGDIWQIIGVDSHTVSLRNTKDACTLQTSAFLADPTLQVAGDHTNEDGQFNVPGHWSTTNASGVLSSAGVKELEQHKTLERIELVQRFLTGYPQGFPTTLDEVSDPELGPTAGTKTARLARLGKVLAVSQRQARAIVERFEKDGPLGLVDQRKTQQSDPLSGCPPPLRDVITQHLDDTTNASRRTTATLIKFIRRTMIKEHPSVEVPKDTVLRRYIKALSLSRGRHLSTKTQRGNSSRGAVAPVRGRSLRPFDRVEIDATVLDAMVLFPGQGVETRPTLLTAVDVYSRSIVAWRIISEKESRVDVALLLYQMMTPKVVPKAWGETAQWRYGVPAHLVFGTDSITPDETFAGVPCGIPTSILVDWGKANISSDVRRVACQLGITIEMARPATGSDKAHVETYHRRVSQQFASQLPGYTGPSTEDRGDRKHVEDEACLTVDEVEEAFGRWVATVYQNKPHKGLPFPGLLGSFLTPNDAYDIAIGSSGILRVLADRNAAISLLPAAMRPLHHYGFEINHVRYNNPDLQLQVGITSPFDADKNTWPVRWDPRDRSIAWMWQPHPTTPDLGTWLEVPSTTLALAGPMNQSRWTVIKDMLKKGATSNFTPELVKAAEDSLFNGLPKPGTEGRAARHTAISKSKVNEAARDRARWGDTTPTYPPWQPHPDSALDYQDETLYSQGDDLDAGYEDEIIHSSEGGVA